MIRLGRGGLLLNDYGSGQVLLTVTLDVVPSNRVRGGHRAMVREQPCRSLSNFQGSSRGLPRTAWPKRSRHHVRRTEVSCAWEADVIDASERTSGIYLPASASRTNHWCSGWPGKCLRQTIIEQPTNVAITGFPKARISTPAPDPLTSRRDIAGPGRIRDSVKHAITHSPTTRTTTLNQPCGPSTTPTVPPDTRHQTPDTRHQRPAASGQQPAASGQRPAATPSQHPTLG
ncbi:hypothetical protein SAMN04489716_4310 [Actinoplanes derwentensis]|uniref:Uncharacterized protein n=1 Tax=Actinoplanes derwentensis TaxID=113562 RepID=A0A1H2B3L8_9ACTN|nr:hypothetical protein SAMN04489716_4310 [Actinoplanes derwentensis]